MSRFLFVVPPLAGHVNPTIGLAGELAGRGHRVAWAGSEMSLRPLLGPDAEVYPTGTRVLREQGEMGFAALKSLWERFIVPYTRFTLPAVDRAVAALEPDVVLTDEVTPAGAIVAQRRGLRWATVACSAMELPRPYRALPKVEAWTAGHLARLWADAGLPPDGLPTGGLPAAGLPRAGPTDPRFSPHLVLWLTSPVLAGPGPWPEPVAMVGPVLAERPAQPDFPWDRLDPDRATVLVTMGTLAADLATDFHARAVAALGVLGERVQAVVVAPPATVPDPPPNVLVVPRVPMLQLLPRLSAVVGHGGMNTACEALAHGVALVLAPIRHDQPVVASQVAAAGAGIRVRFGRVRPEHLRAAVTTVLDEPAYRAAAGRVRDAFAAAGGARAAADRLERLARHQWSTA